MPAHRLERLQQYEPEERECAALIATALATRKRPPLEIGHALEELHEFQFPGREAPWSKDGERKEMRND